MAARHDSRSRQAGAAVRVAASRVAAFRVRAVAPVVALLAGVVFAGCGTTAPSAQSVQADQSFLAAVHSNAPDISSYRSDVAVIRLGHAACDGFRGGVTFQQLADRLILIEGSHPVPTSDLGSVITAAVPSYCPQYQELIK